MTFDNPDRRQIIEFLSSKGEERKALFETAARIKNEHVGNPAHYSQ